MVADLFHPGHVALLARAAELGDELVVALYSDEETARRKRLPVMSVAERAAVLSACRYVDEVIPDSPWVIDGAWLDRHRIDLLVHGDDFDQDRVAAQFPGAAERGIFRYLPYTPGVSTTEIIRRVLDRT